METILRIELMSQFENKLYIDSLHGFRKGRSLMTQLIEVMDYVTKEVDNNNSVDMIYLDFQKAFDTVPHSRLITKHKAYGIEGNLLRWIQDFLHSRKQRVVLNGKHSDRVSMTSGIPKGSVLGPILFIIYINDLTDSIKSLTRLFADDTKLFYTVNNTDDHNILQNDLNSLAKWSERWPLKFNENKCKHVRFGQQDQEIYHLNDVPLTQVSEEKDLGI